MPSQNVMSHGDPSPMMQRALPSSIDNLERAVSDLESSLYSLRAQLSPLLDDVITNKGDKCDVGVASAPHQHSEQIRDLTGRVREVNSIANDLISRLHV